MATNEKEKEAYYNFYEEIAVENLDDINKICQVADKAIEAKFKIRLNETPLIATVFRLTYDAILDVLKSKEKDYSSYEINVCKRLKIGYTTSADDDDEKQGNFMIYIRHCNNADKSEKAEDSPDAKATELLVKWNTENKKDEEISVEDLDKIQNLTVQYFKEKRIGIANPEVILPVFIITYETMTEYLKEKRKAVEEYEYEINFLGCFNIGARVGENEDPIIYIRPFVSDKLKIKDDQKASSKYE